MLRGDFVQSASNHPYRLVRSHGLRGTRGRSAMDTSRAQGLREAVEGLGGSVRE